MSRWKIPDYRVTSVSEVWKSFKLTSQPPPLFILQSLVKIWRAFSVIMKTRCDLLIISKGMKFASEHVDLFCHSRVLVEIFSPYLLLRIIRKTGRGNSNEHGVNWNKAIKSNQILIERTRHCKTPPPINFPRIRTKLKRTSFSFPVISLIRDIRSYQLMSNLIGPHERK